MRKTIYQYGNLSPLPITLTRSIGRHYHLQGWLFADALNAMPADTINTIKQHIISHVDSIYKVDYGRYIHLHDLFDPAAISSLKTLEHGIKTCMLPRKKLQ